MVYGGTISIFFWVVCLWHCFTHKKPRISVRFSLVPSRKIVISELKIMSESHPPYETPHGEWYVSIPTSTFWGCLIWTGFIWLLSSEGASKWLNFWWSTCTVIFSSLLGEFFSVCYGTVPILVWNLPFLKWWIDTTFHSYVKLPDAPGAEQTVYPAPSPLELTISKSFPTAWCGMLW